MANSPKNKAVPKKGNYDRHDTYYKAAKQQGYAARSVFKLEEIDKDFGLIKSSDFVLDLGCAPGSWLQYVASRIQQGSGMAVGIDLLPARVALGPKVHIIQGDINDVSISDELKKRGVMQDDVMFDVVLSDMAPNTSGIKSLDQDRSLVLCEMALEIAKQTLKPGGRFCVKILEGGGMQGFIQACKEVFVDVKIRRPKGTRSASMETYVIGLGKKKN